jgi:hypothetical protein
LTDNDCHGEDLFDFQVFYIPPILVVFEGNPVFLSRWKQRWRCIREKPVNAFFLMRDGVVVIA